MGVLSSQQIRNLINGPEPLVSDLVDIDAQIQPNGIDLTIASLETLTGPGQIGLTNDDRILAPAVDVPFDHDGYAQLATGVYVARLNEAVHLPPNVMALAKPRSSMLRNGVAVHNAVWDAGYAGRSQVQLVVYNPQGFRLAKNARIVQMVFMTLDAATDSPYAGRYQGEHLPPEQGPSK
ncbi:MAG: deoxyuridine 5'-triphosphate nucleotidohydrolase [Chloroflexi bacterium]|nr:deoxyuridine 5'-triphosphate nucleotidohydrolase [Chloroflexota bacterium]